MKSILILGLVGLSFIGYGEISAVLDPSNALKIGRGNVEWKADSVLLDDAYLVMDRKPLKNFTFSFEGRVPADAMAEEVGIWATFRHYDRNHRYVVGLRGEPHNDIYLARYAPDGQDRMLALQPVPTVKPGEWAAVKVTAKEGELRIYLNDQHQVAVDDVSAPFKAGAIGVGGGYHRSEYRNVKLSSEVADATVMQEAEVFADGAYKINFQPGNSPLPEGWKKDSGKTFDSKRGYGWAKSVSTRDRKKTGNPLKDTLVTLAHDQTAAEFSLQMDPGEYLLTLHSGDQHKSDVNLKTPMGAPIRVTTGSGQFKTSHTHVDVGQDGKLSLKFSRTKDGAGTSLNWLVLEPKTALSEAQWAKGFQGVLMTHEKMALRKKQRATYAPLKIPTIGNGRAEVSLDGDWLFLPDYEFFKTGIPQSPEAADDEWHVMPVPAMWSPYAAWLFGETFPDMPYDKGASDSYYEYRHARVEALTFDWEKTRSAWYRKHIELAEMPDGKRFELCFDAIAKISHIYVNGEFVAKNYGMFGEIKLDITEQLKPGSNVIAVRVDQERMGDEALDDDEVIGVAISVELTRKMLTAVPYGMTRQDARGIWQPTKLVITDDAHITDVFVKPRLDGADVDVTLQNAGAGDAVIVPSLIVISEADGNQLVRFSGEKTKLKAGEEKAVTLSFSGKAPKLWSPDNPQLYSFKAALNSGGAVIDETSVVSGFKTFETRGNRFYLNGKPYALRGANQCPNMLAPNDEELADRFMAIMRKNNLNSTRFHGVPGTRTWMDAADRNGILISYEGTWPWLLHAKGPIPPQEAIDIWSDEFSGVIKKYRNHPSLALWTVNNEMKFHIHHRHTPPAKRTPEYDADVLTRWRHVSDAVKMIRKIDPTHPIVADSCYMRGYSWTLDKSPEEMGIDDGDVDDMHEYINWYHLSVFNWFGKGDEAALPNRPFIGQEMSTGYYNGDSGHPVRAYLFAHQTPQSWVGQWAYEHQDPNIFMTRHAMLTKELAEYFRRERRDDWAGSLIFGLVTWFKNQWLADEIEPYPVVSDSLRHAMSPVLISTRLTGRNIFAGEILNQAVSIVNDAEDGKAVGSGELKWSITIDGKIQSKGSVKTPPVDYYTNKEVNVQLKVPDSIPSGKSNAQLHLGLMVNGKLISKNHYALRIGEKTWAVEPVTNGLGTVYVLGGSDSTKALFQTLGLNVQRVSSLNKVQLSDTDRLVINGHLNQADISRMQEVSAAGKGHILWIHPKEQASQVFPDQISSYRKQDGEIVTMLVPESQVFDGIEIGDMAWMGGPGVALVPLSSLGGYHVRWENESLTVLAEEMRAHGYLKTPEDKLKSWVTPLVKIQPKGYTPVLISEMSVEATAGDPIALRLWANLIGNGDMDAWQD